MEKAERCSRLDKGMTAGLIVSRGGGCKVEMEGSEGRAV